MAARENDSPHLALGRGESPACLDIEADKRRRRIFQPAVSARSRFHVGRLPKQLKRADLLVQRSLSLTFFQKSVVSLSQGEVCLSYAGAVELGILLPHLAYVGEYHQRADQT